MNTKSKKEISEIIKKFQSLFKEKTGDEKIEEDSFMLMAGFLSEIELFQSSSDKYSNRKDLAKAIGTSPSYLTQVFRGDKPLNFKTLAKIQEVLEIRFDITAKPFIKPKPALNTISKPPVRRKGTGKKVKISKRKKPMPA
jgi:DNA-binding Xre family transcriptional regulator